MVSKRASIVRTIFFFVFIAVMLSGKEQIWMGLIFASIILAAVFGRYYCGWLCPIHTVIRPVTALKEKLGLKNTDVDKKIGSKIRILVFIVFLGGLFFTIYSMKIGKKFPLPLIIIPIGVIVTILKSERVWHRYICPWGTLLSLTGRFSKKGLKADTCTGCTKCKNECRTDAISMDKGIAKIDPKECLLCFECQDHCPINAIKYGKNY